MKDFPEQLEGRLRRWQWRDEEVPPGDVTVTRIDRLARNTFGLFRIVTHTVAAKARFRSSAEPRASSDRSITTLRRATRTA